MALGMECAISPAKPALTCGLHHSTSPQSAPKPATIEDPSLAKSPDSDRSEIVWEIPLLKRHPLEFVRISLDLVDWVLDPEEIRGDVGANTT